ncbi:MAG: Hsp70 family protein [Polyangiaceae bacterium]
MTTRLSVGIDLGTTHTALATLSLADEAAATRVFEVPQLVAKGSLAARPLLPSCVYFAHESEGALALPWDAGRRFAVGEYARVRGAEASLRVVSSAKSWLCHPSVDRRGPLLPLGAPDDVEKISPVEASFRYLDHLVEAFRAQHPDSPPLGDHEVVLTVPASFDAAARDLTVEAAMAAGLDNVSLLEEPQAALYAWIESAGEAFRKHLQPGDRVLVVDLGGGTSDFSLIAAEEQGGALSLSRVAVGDHILLGGDNMDLALAHTLRQKFLQSGHELDRFQMSALTHASRNAKELLLSDASLAAAPIVVAGRGSQLLGSSLRSELLRSEVEALLVDGFFPRVDRNASPTQRARAALTQLGLPYAADPAITKHLAHFLRRHGVRPTAVLFNGGVVKAPALRQRLLETLNAWLADEGAPAVRVLPGEDPDLAVARGAAYFGRVRHGRGIRIRGGTARAYYVGIESPMPAVPGMEPPINALCVAPFGMEEGSDASLPPQELGVVVGEPVTFRFFGSSVRRGDQAGTLLEAWKPDELEELSPIGDHVARRRQSSRRLRADSLGGSNHGRGYLAARRASARAAQRGRALEGRAQRAPSRTMSQRFVVGIDLGTTNTVVAYARSDDKALQVFEIPQWVSASETEARPLLPSCLYAPLPAELSRDDQPWIPGSYAQQRGRQTPGRLIASAKSWLCHGAVNRTAPILPWGVEPSAELEKLSPIDASQRVLEHVVHAWDAAFPSDPLCQQSIVLTVPASFDEVARELTVLAAERAGLKVRLLEEPQAAFYDYLARTPEAELRALLGQRERATVLVCDVGGGTTDLTLIDVTLAAGALQVDRVAVGGHLLLGGDNIDLALAHRAEQALVEPPQRLPLERFNQLVLACRAAKEKLLAADAPERVRISVAGSGSALVGATLSTELLRDDIASLVFDGFLPMVERAAQPQRARAALRAIGLPYEADAAITRHLAAFFARHSEQAAPAALLLNGGLFRAERVAQRVRDVVGQWGTGEVMLLPQPHPDLAVARGAVAYGLSLLGHGMRIGGGTPHGFYVAVDAEGERRALCVVPRGAREGERHLAKSPGLVLRVGTPVRFELFAADTRSADVPGNIVEIDEERFMALPPLTTRIDASEVDDGSVSEVDVALEGELSAVGTLELACVEQAPDSARRFRLAFDLRADAARASQRPREPSRPPSSTNSRFREAEEALLRVFGKGRGDVKPRETKDLLRELERLLGERRSWSAEQNRALFDVVAPHHAARRRSEDHERVFWMLAGYCLRPGMGYPGDARRVALLAPLFSAGLGFPQQARGWQQFFIAFRRIAAGLEAAEQVAMRQLMDPSFAPVEAKLKKPKQFRPLAPEEMLELGSFLERVPFELRSALGGWLLERTWSSKEPRVWAAIGRIGARVPAYASVDHVLPPSTAERYLDHLLRERWQDLPSAPRAATELSRFTDDRARDVSESARREVEKRLLAVQAPDDWVRSVREFVPATVTDGAAWFDDELPVGLVLKGS